MGLKHTAFSLISIATLALSAGCFESDATLCDTGITCPVGTQCAKNQAICITDTCGNGQLDDGEDCDDGNKISGDGCSADCKFEGCGNGIVDIALKEACDDGNTLDGDGCSSDCKTNERCGNGVIDVDLGEVCDDGNNVSGDGCSADCLSEEKCGNGYIDLILGEECEPTLPVPSTLTGVICDNNCRFTFGLIQNDGAQHRGDDTPSPFSLQKQCRISLKLAVDAWDTTGTTNDPVTSVRGRIVSDRGELNCRLIDGGLCVSDFIDCSDTVHLAILPDDERAIDMNTLDMNIDWGVPGCTQQAWNQETFLDDNGAHPNWCAITLSESEPDKVINVTYRNTFWDNPYQRLCTLNLVITHHTLPENQASQDQDNFNNSLTTFPGHVISSAGGIYCGGSTGKCISDPIPCDQPVTLSLVLDDLPLDRNYSTIDTVVEGIAWLDQPNCYPNTTPELIPDDGGFRVQEPISTDAFWCTVEFPQGSEATSLMTVTLDYDPYTASPFRKMCSRFAKDIGSNATDCIAKISQAVKKELSEVFPTTDSNMLQRCDYLLSEFFIQLEEFYWSPMDFPVEEIAPQLIFPVLLGTKSLSEVIAPPQFFLDEEMDPPENPNFLEQLYSMAGYSTYDLYRCLTSELPSN